MAWNLKTEYSKEFQNEIREKFKKFKVQLSNFQNYNKKYDLKIGDTIHIRNGFDVEIVTEVLGFEISCGVENRVYLLWDCYWYSVPLDIRFIKKAE